jgi:hypothetical protein
MISCSEIDQLWTFREEHKVSTIASVGLEMTMLMVTTWGVCSHLVVLEAL